MSVESTQSGLPGQLWRAGRSQCCGHFTLCVQRVEIRGTDSLLDFVLKLRWGKGLTSNKKDTTSR